MTLEQKAIDAIATACMIDFATPLDWAQRSRALALAVRGGDRDNVQRMLADFARRRANSKENSHWMDDKKETT